MASRARQNWPKHSYLFDWNTQYSTRWWLWYWFWFRVRQKWVWEKWEKIMRKLLWEKWELREIIIKKVYEKNVYNEVSDWDIQSLYLFFLLYLKNLLFPWLLMKVLLTLFVKLDHHLSVMEVMFVLMVLLPVLVLVRTVVYHTYGWSR